MQEEDAMREARDLGPHRAILERFEVAWSEPDSDEESLIADFLCQVPASDQASVRAALESLARHLRQPSSGKSTAQPAEPGDTVAPATAPDSRPLASVPESALPSAREQVDATMAGGQGVTPTVEGSTSGAEPGVTSAPDMTVDPSTGERYLATSGAPPRSFDDYEIIQELGRGGMGVVYKAHEKSTGRLVCVKMMLSGEYASQDALRRFQIETEAAASLDHPNIVPIYHAGLVNNIPYFAMKFIDGKSMDAIDRNEFKDKPRQGVELMVKICRAIDFAHSRGILHRDLKPANILLDQEGEPHITDFGLAKKMDDDSGQTRSGMIMGTPDYMSPEQAVGASALVTVTSDVYSLGSILFDMLTGQPPFKSATIVETLSRVTKEPARTPTTLNRRVGKDLETICLKCLEKDPDKRYRSAALLADELDRFLHGEPILGRPVGSAERMWRWCRRNPGLATMSAAVLLMLVTVAVGSAIAAYQIDKRRSEAVVARGEAEEARLLADANAKVAEENARVADEQRTLALDTLHNLVTKVEAKLRDRADLADLQKDVLQDALNGLQAVSRTAENSGRADRTVGVAHQRMADILERLGKTSESTEEHRKAIAIFKVLSQADPNDDWARWNTAISYDKLGDRQASIDKDAAADLYRESLALREQLAQTSNNEELTASERQRALLISAAKLGSLAMQQGRPAEARAWFEKSLQQSEAMLENDPTNEAFKLAVAGSCSLLARVSFSLGDLEATHDYCHRALDLRKELHAEDSTSVKAASNLASSFEALGDVELQTGHTQEAQVQYESAVTLLERLHVQDLTDAQVKEDLATLYYKLATALLRLDDQAAAEPTYAKCLELREQLLEADPDDPDKQISVMLARARCGLHKEAADLADQLSQNAAGNAGSLFMVACGYALCAGAAAGSGDPQDQSLQQAYTQTALDTLGETLKLGYRDRVALQTDPDLDPVRGNKQFEEMLANLAEPAVE